MFICAPPFPLSYTILFGTNLASRLQNPLSLRERARVRESKKDASTFIPSS
jgi:hypothetical protein